MGINLQRFYIFTNNAGVSTKMSHQNLNINTPGILLILRYRRVGLTHAVASPYESCQPDSAWHLNNFKAQSLHNNQVIEEGHIMCTLHAQCCRGKEQHCNDMPLPNVIKLAKETHIYQDSFTHTGIKFVKHDSFAHTGIYKVFKHFWVFSPVLLTMRSTSCLQYTSSIITIP